ncbi:MAG: hypothetical protein M3Y81_04710 [Chloroflexota bacterium]|nr:hypothetical protein [Chloroflexota bacterium]
MLDDMFSFIDPIVGLSEDGMAHMVIRAELFFDFLQENDIERPVGLPESETGIPWEVALSLLKPDELEKLKRYVAAYRAKHGSG